MFGADAAPTELGYLYLHDYKDAVPTGLRLQADSNQTSPPQIAKRVFDFAIPWNRVH
jgi:hypothetical protein